MLAEEGEPQRPHAARAVEHHLEHAAGMGLRVVGERQGQGVLEIVRHHGEPPAMGQPVGMQRDEDAGGDREQAEADPGQDQHVDGRSRRAAGRSPARSTACRSARRTASARRRRPPRAGYWRTPGSGRAAFRGRALQARGHRSRTETLEHDAEKWDRSDDIMLQLLAGGGHRPAPEQLIRAEP